MGGRRAGGVWGQGGRTHEAEAVHGGDEGEEETAGQHRAVEPEDTSQAQVKRVSE